MPGKEQRLLGKGEDGSEEAAQSKDAFRSPGAVWTAVWEQRLPEGYRGSRVLKESQVQSQRTKSQTQWAMSVTLAFWETESGAGRFEANKNYVKPERDTRVRRDRRSRDTPALWESHWS